MDFARINVGTGGWSDNNDPPYNKLKDYAKVFDFVELNSTFYEIPHIARSRSWRRTIPESFLFTVKCSKIVTHEERLQPTERSLEALKKVVEVCNELRARVLILQTPRSLLFGDKVARGFHDLLGSVSFGSLALGLDHGGRYPVALPPNLVKSMEEHGIIHVVDLLKEDPAIDQDILYLRLFGVKVSDRELSLMLERFMSSNSKEAFVSSHYLKMVDPALRILSMLGRRMDRYVSPTS